MAKCNLFISYSHKDVNYLNELREFINETSLPEFNIWDDGQIELGDKWDETIKKKLATADVILFIVSQSFLNSPYIRNHELTAALKRNKEGNCTLIPIFARDFDLEIESYAEITSLQGIPNDAFLSNVTTGRDKYYVILQKKIKRLASFYKPDLGPVYEDDLVLADKLDANKKIFLSISDSAEANKRRKGFIYQMLSKKKYENWPYDIAPGIEEAEAILQYSENDQKSILEKIINESVYAIHVFNSENFNAPLTRFQYDAAQKGKQDLSPFKNINWVLNSDLKESLGIEYLTNPTVTDVDYESVCELLNNLDVDKKLFIDSLREKHSPQKKVYMFYDFKKDHENPTRIRLKVKLEKEKNISVIGRNVHKLSEEKKFMEQCQGAIIFYGSSDARWFVKRQDTLLFSSNLNRAVCIDEPNFKEKIDRDICKNEINIIRGKGNLEFETDSDIFINQLKK